MNESTLVPREEVSDLDWLARNVHKWVPNELLRMKPCDNGNGTSRASWCYSGDGGFTKEQWLARRAELQNKPSFDDHPDAKCFAQNNKGTWYKNIKSDNVSATDDGEWLNNCMNRGWQMLGAGEVLGDWRDTLEKRPADLSEQAVMSRLQEATDNVLAAAPDIMADKYKFEPFVSVEDAKPKYDAAIDKTFGNIKHDTCMMSSRRVCNELREEMEKEDAATAKQPAPKGIGNPILGMVLADLTNRALEGKEKYGEPLLAHNGRNPLWDAYQEALDLAMYLRQAIEEQK